MRRRRRRRRPPDFTLTQRSHRHNQSKDEGLNPTTANQEQGGGRLSFSYRRRKIFPPINLILMFGVYFSVSEMLTAGSDPQILMIPS